MNRHGVKVDKVNIFFFSFKGGTKKSTIDQLTLPPTMGMRQNGTYWHSFGEWLKREGHDWESLSLERLCRLGVDYWNSALDPHDLPRRFDRLATKEEAP